MTVDACAALVQRGDPDRFAATMTAPVAARAPLFVLYAFNLEVARAPWVTKEAMIAEMRLQWWRDILAEAARGQSRAHEVAGPLAALIRDNDLPAGLLDRLVEARRWDIYADPFEDRAAFDAYLDDTAAGLFWAGACALGAPAAAEAPVRAFGWAAGLAAYLRAVPALEDRGRVPLIDGRAEAVAALAREGLARLDDYARTRAAIPQPARAALHAGWQAPALLRLAAREPLRVADGTLALSEFARRFGLTRLSLLGL
ncbi:squalene/phytoene synthase family protein [Paragemmobacter straminiformis]|uniref:Squalene/phytoene synthase family protein n=1 Tax=Paragemmobacter straminiformis TaxID=2045119 RepID=A0A842I922_9RHOB|nr:squalene/phytoene synthase family protein [Gemmobacter straminiformis]MBC2835574.1 squalene/phytoene synthase family protein [Gemmobacter straminiformis]